MAKREKEDDKREEKRAPISPLALSRELVKAFNTDVPDKIAWSLAADDDNPTDVKEFISFGSTLLNYICTNRKNGGAPVGKITEIAGEEASGKSLICAHLIAECQKRGGIAIYMDTENAANPAFMQQLGVDLKQLVYLQPGTIEDVGEQLVKSIIMTRTKAPDRLVLVIWDGVAATPTKAEVEGTLDTNMNQNLERAKIIAKMMRKVTDTLGKERICFVITNQLKVAIGVTYGDQFYTPGGKGIPYAASLRIRLTRSTQNRDEKTKQVYGIRTLAQAVKCRFGPPLRKCEFNIMFADGIDDVASWFVKLHEVGEIEKADGFCYLTSWPSGKIEEKGVNKGKDRGIVFRESAWRELLTGDTKIKQHVVDLIDKHMIVRYGQVPKDFAPEATLTDLVVTKASDKAVDDDTFTDESSAQTQIGG